MIQEEKIQSKIHIVRGHKVMLDRELAGLYGVETRRLREQVKRNKNKFPEHFMFQLNEEEVIIMVSQNAIPSKKHLGGYYPYVFTEHGILQLANVLNSERATIMSIKIIEVFVQMRNVLLLHKDLLLKIEEIQRKVAGHDEKIVTIFNYLKQFVKDQETPRKKIGFKQKK